MLWVLKSAKVPICEGIEATPIYYFGTNASTRIACAANFGNLRIATPFAGYVAVSPSRFYVLLFKPFEVLDPPTDIQPGRLLILNWCMATELKYKFEH